MTFQNYQRHVLKDDNNQTSEYAISPEVPPSMINHLLENKYYFLSFAVQKLGCEALLFSYLWTNMIIINPF